MQRAPVAVCLPHVVVLNFSHPTPPEPRLHPPPAFRRPTRNACASPTRRRIRSPSRCVPARPNGTRSRPRPPCVCRRTGTRCSRSDCGSRAHRTPNARAPRTRTSSTCTAITLVRNSLACFTRGARRPRPKRRRCLAPRRLRRKGYALVFLFEISLRVVLYFSNRFLLLPNAPILSPEHCVGLVGVCGRRRVLRLVVRIVCAIAARSRAFVVVASASRRCCCARAIARALVGRARDRVCAFASRARRGARATACARAAARDGRGRR